MTGEAITDNDVAEALGQLPEEFLKMLGPYKSILKPLDEDNKLFEIFYGPEGDEIIARCFPSGCIRLNAKDITKIDVFGGPPAAPDAAGVTADK